MSSRMPRHLKIGLIVLVVGFAITLGLFVDVIGRIQTMVHEKEPAGNPFTPPAVPLYERTDPPMAVKVFFPGMKDDVILSAEDQTIRRSGELANRARQILQKVLEGPTNRERALLERLQQIVNDLERALHRRNLMGLNRPNIGIYM